MFIKRGDGKILTVFKTNTKKAVDALINSSDGIVSAVEDLEDLKSKKAEKSEEVEIKTVDGKSE